MAIIDKSKKNSKASFDNNSTRIFLANETKDKQESVLDRKKNFVILNCFYLTDYDIWLKKFFENIIDKKMETFPQKV